MEWLTQNWTWIVVAIGFLLLMQRGRAFGRHGATHGTGPGKQVAGSGAPPGAALDPVSGKTLRTDGALTTVRRGQVYYFESAGTRRRFEADPEKYADHAPATETEHQHRHGGCC